MSVHQIEEYYIHVDLTNCTDDNREKIRVLLIENDCQDFEFTDTDLTVDGFESACAAVGIDDIIYDILNG